MSTQTFETKTNAERHAAHCEPPAKVDRQEIYGLPVDTTIAFSNHKGIYKPRIEKRQRKLLKRVSFLAAFLEKGERILHVAVGCSPISFLEQLLTGAILYSLKRAVFVFTDRRILHIPCSPNLNYRSCLAQILYADCRRIYMRFSTLVAVYRSGRSEKFTCISGQSRKKITRLLKELQPPTQTSPELERSHLCPQCSRPLIKNYYACPHCNLKFKTRPVATFLSLVFPGGGYFYTRHPVLGIFEAIMESLFTAMLAFISWAYYLQNFCGAKPDGASEFARLGGYVAAVFDQQGLSQAIAVCVIILVFEKLVTILYANKSVEDFIPRRRQVMPKLEDVQQYRSSANENHVDSIGWRSR